MGAPAPPRYLHADVFNSVTLHCRRTTPGLPEDVLLESTMDFVEVRHVFGSFILQIPCTRAPIESAEKETVFVR